MLINFLQVSTIFAAATTGKICGKIIDSKPGEELIGVTVLVEGTPMGASTDFEGKYMIAYLKPGFYILIAFYVSYTKKSIKNIEVKGCELSNCACYAI